MATTAKRELTQVEIDFMQLDVLITLAEGKFNDIQTKNPKYLNPTLSKELLKAQRIINNICDRLFSKFDLGTADIVNARLRGIDETIQALFSMSDESKNKVFKYTSEVFTEEYNKFYGK
jgi:hypothetical protein